MSESVVRQQHSDDPQQRELLRVCRIGRAQGLKGEVTVQVFTDEPDYRFEPGSLLYTRDSEQEFEVAHSRTFKNRWIIHFEGVDDRDAAEALNAARYEFMRYGLNNIPDEYLQNYASEMLKKQDRVEGLINSLLQKKLCAALKNVVTMEHKQISVEDFTELVKE